jgi:hypothetical protein
MRGFVLEDLVLGHTSVGTGIRRAGERGFESRWGTVFLGGQAGEDRLRPRTGAADRVGTIPEDMRRSIADRDDEDRTPECRAQPS